MLKQWISIAVLIMVAFCGAPQTASASFHNGGVGPCNGCHTIHNSENGLPNTTGTGSSLLRASDPSSICLNCHAGPGGPSTPSVFSFDGSALTPGGDFYWMTKTYTWATGSSPASGHGHNVIAQDFVLVEDTTNIQAPGGTFLSSNLTCISCHDPHGGANGGTKSGALPVSASGSYGQDPAAGTQVGNYRLLGGVGYTVDGYSFNNPAPIARQSDIDPFAESDTSHVDYGSGMSEWCANCHADILNMEHQAGGSSFDHPIGNNANLESSIIANYNSYIRTGDLTGSIATAYLQFVPFERGATSSALLDPSSTQGPDTNSNVMCLTCHRAHASAFPYAGRWDFTASLLADSHPALGDVGAAANDVDNSYYGRNIAVEFGSGQGQFCEKCHAGGTP